MTDNFSTEIVPLAVTNFRNNQRKFGIKLDDRRRHMYIIGKSGTGKSVLLENMIYTDLRAGHGLAVVDPHGDLVEKVLDLVPSNRVNDVIYFNPSDMDYPIAFNPLESVNPKYRHMVASGLVGVFKKIWADSWGPRLEYILRNAILSLLEYPSSTLLGITRILVDKYYRKKVLEKVTDPVVRSFWIDEYDNYNEKFRTEAISPIQNKIGQFLSSAIIRNIVGQPKSTINLRKIMDEQKVLLMDLSKGRMGEDNSALLGAMMITKLQLAAMSRIDIPEYQRKDFFLYVDEFQNFATESFATILSEARKYRLNLIVAHQYIEQLGEEVRAAVFGNIGTIIVFRVGAEDAEFLEKEFTPTFNQTDLVNLPNYHIYLKLMIDGVTSDPFSAVTMPPISVRHSNRSSIIKVSRERYAQDRAKVEAKILRWAGVEEVFKETAQEESRSLSEEEMSYRAAPSGRKESRTGGQHESSEPPRLNLIQPSSEMFEDKCWVCGRKVILPFKPDGIRPVYCKEDMKKVKQGLIPKPKPHLVVKDSTVVHAVDNLPVVENTTPASTPHQPDSQDQSASKAANKHSSPQTSIVSHELKLTDMLSAQPVPFKTKPPATKTVKSDDSKIHSLKPNQVIKFSHE